MNKKTLSLPRFRFTCNKTTEPPVTSPITAWMQTPCRKKNSPFWQFDKARSSPKHAPLIHGPCKDVFPS